MVYREPGMGGDGGRRKAAYSWIRHDRSNQPEWALPAEAALVALSTVLLVVNHLRDTAIPWAAIAAVIMVHLRRSGLGRWWR